MKFFNKRIKSDDVLDIINKKNYWTRLPMMLLGMTLLAISFNIFYVPFKIVPGGVSGLSLIISSFTTISPSSFMYMVNAGLLYIALFTLGPKFTLKAFLVSMLLPFLIDATSFLQDIITIGHGKEVMVCIYAGLLSGLGIGLVYKAGFTTGGLDTLKAVLAKKGNIPIGKAMFIIDGAVVLLGTVFFGPMVFMYSIIVIYLIGFTTDRILLGVSNSKAFYIISSKKDEIIEFAANSLGVKTSIIKVKGSLHETDHEMLLIIVPTKDYYNLKEAIRIIDVNAFFTIIDVYQTYGLNDQVLPSKTY